MVLPIFCLVWSMEAHSHWDGHGCSPRAGNPHILCSHVTHTKQWSCSDDRDVHWHGVGPCWEPEYIFTCGSRRIPFRKQTARQIIDVICCLLPIHAQCAYFNDGVAGDFRVVVLVASRTPHTAILWKTTVQVLHSITECVWNSSCAWLRHRSLVVSKFCYKKC